MGKNKPTYHRTTITVPSDLKRRMDAAGNAVNWSAVAARAFEKELAEIESKGDKSEMATLIERLRAAKARVEDDDTRAGREAARRWMDRMAGEPASADDLLRCIARLNRFHEQSGRDWDAFFVPNEGDAFGVEEQFYFVLYPEDDHDRQTAAEFWEFVTDSADSPDASFVQAFAEGVLDIWDEVKDKL